MSSAIVVAICSGIAYALMAVIYKQVEESRCRPAGFLVTFMTTGGIIMLTWALMEPTTWSDPRLWVLGVGGGLLTYLAILLLTRANALGPASVAWTMLNLSLVVPILVAPLCFHEPLLPMDGFMFAAFVVMLVLFALGMRSSHEVAAPQFAVFLGLAGATFLADGLCQIANKVKYLWFADANTAAMPALSFIAGGACALFVYLRREGRQPLRAVEWRYGIAAGVACSVGVFCLLSAMRLPVVVSLPIVKGIALMGGVLLITWRFREPLTPVKAVGLGCGLLVLLLATLRHPLTSWLQQLLFQQ